MIHFQHVELGAWYGIVYRFGAAGDALPTHTHGEDELHDVRVLQGAARVTVAGKPDITLGPGDRAVFDGRKQHSVIADAAGTMTLHRLLNGRPAWYDKLSAADLKGTL